MPNIIAVGQIESSIFVIRGKKVMLDNDLAKKRFPHDFMFQLNKNEKEKLVANCDRFNSVK